jgi:hypothetical protein
VSQDTGKNDAAVPAVAVNRDGTVGIAWYDRRRDPMDRCYQLYYSVSLDGGETFLPNAQANEHSACPAESGNWALVAFSPHGLETERRPAIGIRALAERFPNGGDTQGFAAGNDGVFHSAWINSVSGVMQLWHSTLAVDTAKAASAFQSPFMSSRLDLSRDLDLKVSEPSIDFTTHKISVTVSLLNPLPITVQGPFTVVLDNVRWSSLENVQAVNSDNRVSGRGAAWDFIVNGAPSLRPQQESDVRVLRWEFKGDASQENGEPLFYSHFIILGQPQNSPSPSTNAKPR